MKIGWRNYATRKDKLETIALHYMEMTPEQSWLAWRQLMGIMLELSEPNGYTPKFNDLLLGIIRASVHAKSKHEQTTTDLSP